MRLRPVLTATVAAAGTIAMAVLAGPAVAATITGTQGDDSLIGTTSADVIKAKAGDDRAWGRRGPDVMEGGVGDDELQGMRGRDHLNGGPGADRSFGQRGNDVIDDATGAAVDLISGGRGADHIFANFKDKVRAGSGDDRIEFVYAGTGSISCGAGNDTVIFNQVSDVTTYGCENVLVQPAG